MEASAGDGVYYHGSLVEHHGLYMIDIRELDNRYTLISADNPEDMLRHVRRQSFDVLLPITALDRWLES